MQNNKAAKLYVILPRKNKWGDTAITLISVKRLPILEANCPTDEILATHFAAEKVRIQIARNKKEEYAVQPLTLAVTGDVYSDICKEIKGIDPKFNMSEYVALTLGNPYIPCCVITCVEFIKNRIKL